MLVVLESDEQRITEQSFHFKVHNACSSLIFNVPRNRSHQRLNGRTSLLKLSLFLLHLLFALFLTLVTSSSTILKSPLKLSSGLLKIERRYYHVNRNAGVTGRPDISDHL